MKTLQVEMLILTREKREIFAIWSLYYASRVARRDYWSLIPLVLYLYSYAMDLWLRTTLQMNSIVIRHINAGRKWGLFWDEIVKIGVHPNGTTVLFTEGEVYTFTGLEPFQGKDKAAMLELYNHQIEARGIPTEPLTNDELSALVRMPSGRGGYKRD